MSIGLYRLREWRHGEASDLHLAGVQSMVTHIPNREADAPCSTVTIKRRSSAPHRGWRQAGLDQAHHFGHQAIEHGALLTMDEEMTACKPLDAARRAGFLQPGLNLLGGADRGILLAR